MVDTGVYFETLRPRTLKQAIALLARYGTRARVVAGATDCLVRIPAGKMKADYLVSLDRLRSLRSIRFNPRDGLSIGAATTFNELIEHPHVQRRYPALAEASRLVGSYQLRNIATIGGNICNASPSADSVPPLLAHDARVEVQGPTGGRSILLDRFFSGPGQTVMHPGEVLTRMIVPPPPKRTGGSYERSTPRRAMDIAMVGVGVALTLGEDERCQECRIALGAVAPTPVRASQAEALVRGKALTEELMREAGRVAAGECSPITDVRGSAQGRRDLVEMLVRRGLRVALERARSAR